MSIIRDKYDNLSPQSWALSDEVVLAQAWKKSQAYIRRHNSFADFLELDVSAIKLEGNLKEWGEQIAQSKFEPAPLRLVPAPKNAAWEFRNRVDPNDPIVAVSDWRPVHHGEQVSGASRGDAQAMRPLAHLSIRDQTLATAVMLCLANIVESAQGNPEHTGLGEDKRPGAVSYGNRLHCMLMAA